MPRLRSIFPILFLPSSSGPPVEAQVPRTPAGAGTGAARTRPFRPVIVLLALLGLLAARAGTGAGQSLPNLEPGLLSAPDTFWLDPALTDTSWIAGAPPETRPRIVAWFSSQLLPAANSYEEATERLRETPRRPLRRRVVDRLKSLSRESWRAARPRLEELAEEGVVTDCSPLWIVNGFECRIPLDVDAEELGALADVPGVRAVFRAFPLGPPDRPDEMGPRWISPERSPWRTSPVPWHLEALSVPRAWDELDLSGRGVLNVVHDYGFRLDATHVAPSLWTNDGETPDNGIDDDGNGLVDDVHGFDFDAGDALLNTPTPTVGEHIHGNTVAGIITGRSPVDTETQLGVAPDSRWSAVAGLARFERALEWALDQGADTYTMSFSLEGLGHLRAHWRKAMEHAALAGLFAVSGAGNFGDPERGNYVATPRQMRIPEGIPLAVFGVAGLGPDGQRPAYSSRGPVLWDVVHYDQEYVPKPDVSTVNASIVAADFRSRETGPVNGNSFAGPHLTGILALMLEADPDLTPWRAREILIETARDVGSPGYDFATGYGQVDAYEAARAVLRTKQSEPRGAASPPTHR